MAKRVENLEPMRELAEVDLPELTAADVASHTPPASEDAPGEASAPPAAAPKVVKDLAQGAAGRRIMTVADMDAIKNETARALAQQPKVQVFLPKIEGLKDPKFQVETVQVNGWIIAVNRGEFVEVPMTVAEILRDAGYPVNLPAAG